MTSIRVLVASYNVSKLSPQNVDADFHDFTAALNLTSLNGAPSYDIVAVNLQEVGWIKLHEVVGQTLFWEEPWSLVFRNIITPSGYSLLSCTWSDRAKLLGIATMIFVRTEILLCVERIETCSVKLGLGGFFGHKGAVSVEVSLLGAKVTFVNSHFAPHVNAVDVRVSNFRTCDEILRLESLVEKGYVVFAGDLNFRIDGLGLDEVLSLIRERRLAELAKNDQLKRVQAEGRCLVGYEEAELNFVPSYRFLVGCDEYDKKRIPAWCDRILVKKCASSKAFEASVAFDSYKCLTDVCYSDHKPVLSTFQITVPLPFGSTQTPVTFHFPCLPRDVWFTEQNNLCQFSIDLSICSKRLSALEVAPFSVSWFDWIGLYEENLSCDCAPVTWQYVYCAWEESKKSTGSDSGAAETTIQNILFKARYMETGSFRLGYFSRQFNCLIGLSSVFQIVYGAVERGVESNEVT